MRKSKWFTLYFCKKCIIQLSNRELMNSKGRCPHCGNKGRYAFTIVDHIEKAARNVYYKPWYIFWERPTLEFKNDVKPMSYYRII